MNSAQEFDVVVIGAGMGGLASAALWAKKSSVALIESHYSVGGCAGYFKRREGVYDVGATTLSGLVEGRPTSRLIKTLGLELDLVPCDPGVISHLGKKRFRFFRDVDKLINEIRTVFDLEMRDTIFDWINKEELLWEVLDVIRPINMIDISIIKQALSSKSKKLALSPNIFIKSFYDILPKECKSNTEFVRFLDELLMISTQQSSKTCPAFMGILGFLYPRDTFAIKGGMQHLCQTLLKKNKELNVEVKLSCPVTNVIKKEDHFLVYTPKGNFKAKKVISNIAPKVFDSIYSQSCYIEQETSDIWGAMTAYFAVKTKIPIMDLYHQIHLSESSLFFSISSINNENANDFQTVTVSTHIDKKEIKSRDENYDSIKKSFADLVLKEFKKAFKEYEIEEIVFDSVGTPLTFNRYVGRPEGEVGGLVHNSIFSLNRLLSNRSSKVKGLYFTGDYSFPGQGIVSVFQSAFNTLE